MTTATLAFTLPEEAEEHRCALDGGRWKAVVERLTAEWRNEAKHGKPKDAARAAWARAALYQAVRDEGLEGWDL
jgi:hypothetical protein